MKLEFGSDEFEKIRAERKIWMENHEVQVVNGLLVEPIDTMYINSWIVDDNHVRPCIIEGRKIRPLISGKPGPYLTRNYRVIYTKVRFQN